LSYWLKQFELIVRQDEAAKHERSEREEVIKVIALIDAPPDVLEIIVRDGRVSFERVTITIQELKEIM
jgi:hypothetical protein